MKNLYIKSYPPKDNKAKEVQVYIDKLNFEFNLSFWISFFKNSIFDISFDLFNLIFIWVNKEEKVDHAGFNIRLKLFWINVEFSYYDIRHWNHEENRWENEEDILKEQEEYEKNNIIRQ